MMTFVDFVTMVTFTILGALYIKWAVEYFKNRKYFLFGAFIMTTIQTIIILIRSMIA